MTTRRTRRRMSVSIVLADRQFLFRMGIRRLLAEEEDMEIVAETSESGEASSLIATMSPQVVMVDADLRPQTGVELAGVIHRHHPQVSIILVTEDVEEKGIFQAMKAGIAARLSRWATRQELVNVIREVSQGDVHLREDLLHRPKVAALVLEEFQHSRAVEQGVEALRIPLTDKEEEVLTQVAQGRSSSEIADSLRLDSKALQDVLTSILLKLASNKQTSDTVSGRSRNSKIPKPAN